MQKSDYSKLAVEEIHHFWELLGLYGEWRAQFSFGTSAPCEECDESNNGQDVTGSVDISPEYRAARIEFHPHLRPERYKITAAHECLHILFYQIELAIDRMKEPARSLLRDKLHAIIERLSAALAADDMEMVTEIDSAGTPWELDAAKEAGAAQPIEEADS